MLAQYFEIGADAIGRARRRAPVSKVVGADQQYHHFWLQAGEIAVFQPL
jgi:hypothetical protein